MASNGQQRHRTAIATAVNPALAMALIIAVSRPLADGLLLRLINPAAAPRHQELPMHVLRRIRARDPAEDIHGRILVSFPPRPRRDHHGRA